MVAGHPAGGDGGQQRDVGTLHERAGVRAVHRGRGDADGQRDLQVQAGHPGAGGGRLAQPTGGALGRGQGQPGQQDGELLALHAREQRLRRGVLAEQAGGDEQQLVAGGVSEGVGDLGVVVERGEDQAGAGGDRVGGQQRVDLGGQPLPVGQAGEPVVVGVVADLGEQLLLPDGRVDVRQHGVQGGPVALGEGHDVAAPVADLEVAGLAGRGHDGGADQVGRRHAGRGRPPPRSSARASETITGRRRRLDTADRAPAEEVVGVAGAVVPDRAVLGGDDEPGLLVEVGRQPQRHPLGVEQLADGLRRSGGCRPRRR